MNPNDTTISDSNSAARAEASLWIVRLHGPQRSPALDAGFREWLAADPEHAREFERVTEVWDSMSGISSATLPRVERSRPAPRINTFARAALVLLTCGVISAGVYWTMRDVTPSYVTDVGEQRTVRLDDGTRISLNSNTQMETEYARAERRVRLSAGEAYFEVARDPARPFIVLAGDRQITALGTSFVVRYEPQLMTVTLVEGKVSVAAPTLPTQTLLPGERLTMATGRAPQLDQPRLDAVTAWRRAEVILDKTPLAEAVAEMNRYSKTVLVVQDPRVANLQISGVYDAGDSASFARAVARMLKLQAVETEDQILLQSRSD